MKLHLRVLHVDGTVERYAVPYPDGEPVDLVPIGTRLRRQDWTVAAVRCNEAPGYTWLGTADKAHLEALDRAGDW